jgi:hypothetical protein
VDPVTIGAAVSLLLASKFGEGFAGKAGEAGWEHVTEAWHAVTQKFRGHQEASRELALLSEEPKDKARQTAVAERIAAAATADAAFRAELTEIVAKSKASAATAVIIAQAFDSAKQVIITGDHVGPINL